MPAPSYPRHLLVLIHGELSGDGNDLLSQVPSAIPQARDFLFLKTECGRNKKQYFSVDLDGEKVAQEILSVLNICEKQRRPITDISIFGYNIGGLIARHAIGVLYQMNVFSEVKPRNFDTFATPHVGIHKPRNWAKLLLARRVLPFYMEQLLFEDDWEETGRPLLDVMSDPSGVFFQALSMFESIRVYANAVDDGMVPYGSAAIEKIDPFIDYQNSGIIVETYDQTSRYSTLIKSWTLPSDSSQVPRPILRRMRQMLWKESTVYAVLAVVILTLALTLGKPFVEFASILSLAAVLLVASMIVPATWLRSKTIRLCAKRGRLLDTSSVFRTPEEIAEDGGQPIKVSGMSKSALSTTLPTPATPKANPGPGTLEQFMPIQLHAITSLDTLPQLHKNLVWRPGCFTPHRALLGLSLFGYPRADRAGALRHWGDGLLR